MADIQYFSGLPEVGVVPRAPHAGPLLQHVWPNYMDAWSDYTTDPKFAYDPARLADVRTLAERLAGARDTLRPPTV
jgi:hypothetical protein